MKKILILGLLLAPIVANADPVGPSAVPSGGTAVVATASAPYQTAAPANGDSTTVVSASYVKGAYNDAISAINNVADKVSTVEGDLSSLSDFVNSDIEDEIDGKQDKLTIYGSTEINTNVYSSDDLGSLILQGVGRLDSTEPVSAYDTYLATTGGVLAAIKYSTVKAVTTWGDDTDTTNLPLTPAYQ